MLYIAVTEIVPEVFVDVGYKTKSLVKFLTFCATGSFVMWLTTQHTHE